MQLSITSKALRDFWSLTKWVAVVNCDKADGKQKSAHLNGMCGRWAGKKTHNNTAFSSHLPRCHFSAGVKPPTLPRRLSNAVLVRGGGAAFLWRPPPCFLWAKVSLSRQKQGVRVEDLPITARTHRTACILSKMGFTLSYTIVQMFGQTCFYFPG